MEPSVPPDLHKMTLAIHQDTERAYEKRFDRIQTENPRRVLLERLDKAGLRNPFENKGQLSTFLKEY